jgi:hypothetical protein
MSYVTKAYGDTIAIFCAIENTLQHTFQKVVAGTKKKPRDAYQLVFDGVTYTKPTIEEIMAVYKPLRDQANLTADDVKVALADTNAHFKKDEEAIAEALVAVHDIAATVSNAAVNTSPAPTNTTADASPALAPAPAPAPVVEAPVADTTAKAPAPKAKATK